MRTAPLLAREGWWAAFLDAGLPVEQHEAIRSAERTGRPLGGPALVAGLEASLGRALTKAKPGRKPRGDADDEGNCCERWSGN